MVYSVLDCCLSVGFAEFFNSSTSDTEFTVTMDATRDKAEKKKRKVKAKLETTSKKEDVADAVKSIDDLFEGVKKAKKEEAVATSSAKTVTKKGDQKAKTKGLKQKPSKDDFEEDDGGMEFFDDEDEVEGQNGDDSSRTYGVIQSRYRPSQIINPEAPLERIDPATGLPVYKAHILKVGEGGGTPLCPFECACCF